MRAKVMRDTALVEIIFVFTLNNFYIRNQITLIHLKKYPCVKLFWKIRAFKTFQRVRKLFAGLFFSGPSLRNYGTVFYKRRIQYYETLKSENIHAWKVKIYGRKKKGTSNDVKLQRTTINFAFFEKYFTREQLKLSHDNIYFINNCQGLQSWLLQVFSD